MANSEPDKTEELTTEIIEQELDEYIERAGDDQRQREIREKTKASILENWNSKNRELDLSNIIEEDDGRSDSTIYSSVDLEPMDGLTEWPPCICRFSHLKHLRLNNHAIPAIPPEIGQMKNLSLLSMNNNKLTILPSEIGKLKGLNLLHINDNKLLNLPSELRRLTSLERIYASNNNLSTLPEWLGESASLVYVDLRQNQITSFPEPEVMERWAVALVALYDNSQRRIRLEENPIPQGVFLNLNTAINIRRFPHLRFSFTTQHLEEQVEITDDRPLSDAVKGWLPEGSKVQANDFSAYEHEENADQFSLLLDNQVRTSMWANIHTRPILQAQIASALQGIHDAPSDRKKAFDAAWEARTACGDRVTLFGGNIFMMTVLGKQLRENETVANYFQVNILWFIRKEIEVAAAKRSGELTLKDEVEVELHALIVIGEELTKINFAMPALPTAMSFPLLSFTEKTYWQEAAKNIAKKLTTDEVIEFLADPSLQMISRLPLKKFMTMEEGLEKHFPYLVDIKASFIPIKQEMSALAEGDFLKPDPVREVSCKEEALPLFTSLENIGDRDQFLLNELHDSERYLLTDIKRELAYQSLPQITHPTAEGVIAELQLKETTRSIQINNYKQNVQSSFMDEKYSPEESNRKLRKCFRELWLSTHRNRQIAKLELDDRTRQHLLLRSTAIHLEIVKKLKQTLASCPQSRPASQLQSFLLNEAKLAQEFLQHSNDPSVQKAVLDYLAEGHTFNALVKYTPTLLLRKNERNNYVNEETNILDLPPRKSAPACPIYYANGITLLATSDKRVLYVMDEEVLEKSSLHMFSESGLKKIIEENKLKPFSRSVEFSFVNIADKNRIPHRLNAAIRKVDKRILGGKLTSPLSGYIELSKEDKIFLDTTYKENNWKEVKIALGKSTGAWKAVGIHEDKTVMPEGQKPSYIVEIEGGGIQKIGIMTSEHYRNRTMTIVQANTKGIEYNPSYVAGKPQSKDDSVKVFKGIKRT